MVAIMSEALRLLFGDSYLGSVLPVADCPGHEWNARGACFHCAVGRDVIEDRLRREASAAWGVAVDDGWREVET